MSNIKQNRAISRMVTVSLAGVAVLAISGLGAVVYTYRSADHATAALVADAFSTYERALELAVAEKNMEIDITAIQEQAEDAGDVGGDPAYADDVKEDYAGVRQAAVDYATCAAKARAIAAQFNDTATVATIDSISQQVPALRDVALEMARAYVEKGHTEGNVKMKPFDAEVERLKGLTDNVRKAVDTIVNRARSRINDVNTQRASAGTTTLTVSGIIVLLLIAASAGLMLMFQRKLLAPIRRMTDTMAALAQHDLTVEV
jgi:tetrahydromethanopterin S-methyltransferase subunit B